MHLFRYITLVFTALAILCGCVKNVPDAPEQELTYSVPFSISVQHEPETRASFSGSAISAGSYVFAAGDKLYITGGIDNEQVAHINGVLDIASGATTGEAVFNGSLDIDNGYVPESSTVLYATLVGASQVSPNGTFFTITNNKVSGNPTYPSSISASTPLSELVEKYSHFTSTFTYNVRHITLTQQSVFLNFELELYRNSLTLTGESPTVQVDIKSSNGNTVLQSVTGVPVGGNSTISTMEFTTIFPSGTSLQGAQTWINNGDGVHCEPDFSNTLDLEANHYYHVLRSAIEEFTVEAPSTGQGATVTFNYGYSTVEYRKYSGGTWTVWQAYSGAISLSAGEKVSFRGQSSSYANTGGNIPIDNNDYAITSGTPLITVTNRVYIYGDIMSLVCDSNWARHSTVGENAFKYAFSGCTNLTIPDDKNLVLSAETLSSSCYEGMFSGCTNLSKVPILAATSSVPARAYYGMFQGCSNLVTPPASLPATTLGNQAYCQMFANCANLTSAPTFPSTRGTFSGTQIFYRMFAKCQRITAVTGQLFSSDTQLVDECYHGMFRHCRGLVTVPEGYLPSLTLAKWCYRGLFEEAAFTTAPTLPAPTLVNECYRYMFYKCGNLNSIKCLARYSISGNTPNFTTNVAAAGTFTKYTGVTWPTGNAGIPNGWNVQEVSE